METWLSLAFADIFLTPTTSNQELPDPQNFPVSFPASTPLEPPQEALLLNPHSPVHLAP